MSESNPKWYYWGKKKSKCGCCGRPIYNRYYKQRPKYKGQRVHHRGWGE